MTKNIKVLGVQFTPKPADKKYNFSKIEELLEEKKWVSPDLIVLPEVFNSGCGHGSLSDMAEVVNEGQTSEFLSFIALKYNANVVGGSIAEVDYSGKYKNTSLLFGRNGELLEKYSKIHLFSYYGFQEAKFYKAGERVVVADTDIGKIGLSICYDLRFPELYRSLVYNGAEIITCPAAWPYPRLEHWNILNRSRAIENQVYMIGVNQVGLVGEKRYNAGYSSVISPWGDVVASAGSIEDAMFAELDLNKLRKLREDFPVLKDTKNEVYNRV